MSFLIRSSALANYVEFVESLGGDPSDLLAQFGISPVQLTDPEALISFENACRLLESSAEQFHRPEFGLLLSQSYPAPRILGVILMLMQQSSDVGAALGELQRYFYLHNQGVDWELREEGEFAFVVRHQHLTATVPTRQLTDLALSDGLNVLRAFYGRNWQPKWVSFCRPKGETKHQEAFFNAELRFEQEFDGFVFSSRELKIPLAGANENMKRILDQHMASLEVSHHQDIGAQTRLLIKQTLGLKACNIESIARMLSMHKRTLQHQLAEQGITFKELLDEVRFDAAQRSLRDSNTQLTLLAEQLGYAELSAFSRAFKNRFGMSPAQWRKAQQVRLG